MASEILINTLGLVNGSELSGYFWQSLPPEMLNGIYFLIIIAKIFFFILIICLLALIVRIIFGIRDSRNLSFMAKDLHQINLSLSGLLEPMHKLKLDSAEANK